MYEYVPPTVFDYFLSPWFLLHWVDHRPVANRLLSAAITATLSFSAFGNG